jgi:hypothetical protein
MVSFVTLAGLLLLVVNLAFVAVSSGLEWLFAPWGLAVLGVAMEYLQIRQQIAHPTIVVDDGVFVQGKFFPFNRASRAVVRGSSLLLSVESGPRRQRSIGIPLILLPNLPRFLSVLEGVGCEVLHA